MTVTKERIIFDEMPLEDGQIRHVDSGKRETFGVTLAESGKLIFFVGKKLSAEIAVVHDSGYAWKALTRTIKSAYTAEELVKQFGDDSWRSYLSAFCEKYVA